METKEVNSLLRDITDSVGGHMRLNDLRNSVLSISFLEIALSQIYGHSRMSGFIIPYIGDLTRIRNLFGHGNIDDISQEILSLLTKVENHFENLRGVFSDLNINSICRAHPVEVIQIFYGIDGIYNSTNIDYRAHFDQITQFFSEKEGKGQSELSTPSSIRKLYKAIIGEVGSVFDPACGTGSLLATFVDATTHEIVGQDIQKQSIAIARLRFAFEPQINLHAADSLNSRLFSDLKTEAVVINPPFNMKYSAVHLSPSYYTQHGIPPKSNANMLWLQLAISHLKNNGTAMVVLPNGSLSTGGKERSIRKSLIESGWVQAIISVPSGLFTYTSIPTSVWVLSRNRSLQDEILLIDISDRGEVKNRYERDIPRDTIDAVSNCYRSWKVGEGLDSCSRYTAKAVKIDQIVENDFVLTPARYLPVQGIEEYDLSNAVELKSLMTRENQISRSKRKHELLKKISVRDLSSGVDQFEIDLDSLRTFEDTSQEQVYDGDLLCVARNGENLKPSFLPKPNGKIGFVLSNIHAFRIKTEQVRIDYLIQELNKEYVQLQLSRFRSGTTIQSLRVPDFLSVKIVLPPLLEQQEKAVKAEKEIRFQSLAKLHGFENEIARLKEQQRKDLGSKKHNIMQHLNNVKSSSDLLIKFLEKNAGTLNATDVINPKTGITVLKRFQRLGESVDNVLYYVENLTNEIEFQPLEILNAHKLVQECVEKGIQGSNFVFQDNSDKRTFSEQSPDISVSKIDFEELYNNIIQNATQHGFVDEDSIYEFRYSVLIADGKVEVIFENNGKPFPKGMGTKTAYCTRGEKAGKTANTGEGSWKVCQIAQHFGAELEIIDQPGEEYPVAIKLTFELAQ